MVEIILEAVKLLVMVTAFAAGAYFIPWIKGKIGAEKLSALTIYVEKAVYAAQQLLWERTGAERREYATSLISEWCEEHGLTISDEQIRVLLEAAVKGLRIAEGGKNEDK